MYSNVVYTGPVGHQGGARTRPSQRRRVRPRRSTGRPRAQPASPTVSAGSSGRRGGDSSTTGGQPAASITSKTVGPASSQAQERAPWGAALGQRLVSGEGPPFRANKVGNWRGQGAAAVPVATSPVPRCVSDMAATTQEGIRQGLACCPSVGLSFWVKATVMRQENDGSLSPIRVLLLTWLRSEPEPAGLSRSPGPGPQCARRRHFTASYWTLLRLARPASPNLLQWPHSIFLAPVPDSALFLPTSHSPY